MFISAGNFYEESYWRDYRVEVQNDGTVFWTYGGIFSTTCSLNIEHYPFDSQVASRDIHVVLSEIHVLFHPVSPPSMSNTHGTYTDALTFLLQICNITLSNWVYYIEDVDLLCYAQNISVDGMQYI